MTSYLVVRFFSIPLMVAISADLNSKCITILNRKLDEEIYTEQPNSFEVKGDEHKVCHFRCSKWSKQSSSNRT